MKKGEYVYGLDIFRSIAILFVLVGHSLGHSTVPDWLKKVERTGGLGVELFFVLSGFLIGGILLRLMEQDRLRTLEDVLDFWKRRWLRTLPLYVVAYFAFLKLEGQHRLFDHPQYLLFLQNLAWKIPQFFVLSWSLAVEEHFYFFFPLVFILFFMATEKKRSSLWMTVALLFVGVIVYRFSRPRYTDFNELNLGSRAVVLSRLDAIVLGVVMAAIRQYHRPLFGIIRTLTPVWLVLTAVILVWHYMGVPGLMESRALQTLVWFTGINFVFACLLPWFDAMRDKPASLVGNFFAVTSRLSYSMYLGHILAIIVINKALHWFGIFEIIYNAPLVLYPLYFGAFYVVAFGSYAFVEKPFLLLRDEPFSWRGVFRKIWIPCGAVIALMLSV